MDNISIGLQLMGAGMGLVFLLLALLWGLLTLMLRLDRPEAEAASPEAEAASPAQAVVRRPAQIDPQLLAAISVAVLQHRAHRRRQAAPFMRSHLPGTLPSRWVPIGRTRQTSNWIRTRRI